TYDSGDFTKNLKDALHFAAYDGIEARRAAARRQGKLLGIGVATTVAATGGRDYEHAEIRFDPAGGVVLITGSMDHGQGHGTTFKQVLSEKLGIDAAIDIAEVARQSFHSAQLPEDIETGFTERSNFGPADAATFPSGAHVCEVEIDAETGEVRLARYCAVDDVGTMLNPLLCEG